MNSAKFIALCFGFLTITSLIVAPILSCLSGVLCASVGVCGYKKGINNAQYAISALILIIISIRLIWVMQ